MFHIKEDYKKEYLRKLGKKIKKGVKKLFSTKLGRIVGGIGLSMAMGWAAGKLFQGAKALFSTAPPVGGEVAGEVAAQAAGEATAQVAGEVTTEAARKTLGESVKALEGTIAESKNLDKVLSNIQNAGSNTEAMQIFSEDIAVKNISGEFPNIYTNNVTDAVTQVTDVYTGKKPLISETIQPDLTITVDRPDTFSSLAKKPYQGELTDVAYKDLLEAGQFGEAAKKVGVETVQFVKEDLIPDDPGALAGEYGRRELMAAAEDYLYPEEEVMGPPVVAQRRPAEQAQAAYVQDMSSQWMAANNTTRVPSFADITNSFSFGNSTPQYLQQLYEGITPQMLPLPQV